MKNKITDLMDKICDSSQSSNAHCDMTSSKIQMINVPIPTELFNELKVMASEYNQDLNCMAGDFLTLALKEAIEHIPRQEKLHLNVVRRDHELEFAEMQRKQNEFNVGGT